MFVHLFVLFVIWKMKPVYTFFTLAIKKNLFGLSYKSSNTSSTKYSKECVLWFPDDKENFEIINHLHLIFRYYLFKVQDTRKMSLEGLKKNVIKIYNIEQQICFNDSKKEITFFKKMTYTRKPIKMNEIYCKPCLGWGGNVNVSI